MIEKPRPLAGLPPNVHAYDQPVLVHAVETAAPGPLRLGDHLAPGPRGRLEAIGDDVEGEVVVADQRRAAVAEPDGLAAAEDDGWWPVMAENLVSQSVVADKGADPIVVRHQLRHVVAQGGSAFGGGRRGRPALAQVPALGLIPAGGEAGQPGLVRPILAREDEAFEHGAMLRESVGDGYGAHLLSAPATAHPLAPRVPAPRMVERRRG